MKKRFIILTALAVFSVAGCSASNSSDSNIVDGLKKQVADLQKENENLKTQLKEIDKSDTAIETDSEETISDDAESAIDDTSQSEKLLKIGKEGTLGDWSITVTSAEATDSITADYGSYTPDDGNKYFSVSVSVTNNSKTAETFLKSYSLSTDLQAKLLYGDGYEFSATQLMGYKKSLHNETLNPLSNKEGVIAFEIPNDVADSDKKLVLQFTINNESLKFKVR